MNDLDSIHLMQELLKQTRRARNCLKRAKDNVKLAQQWAEVAKQGRNEANLATTCMRCQVRRAKAELKEAKALASKAELIFAAACEGNNQEGKRSTTGDN